MLLTIATSVAHSSDQVEYRGHHDPNFFAELLDAEIDGNTVYVVGVGGFSIFDVTTPSAPTLVGRWQPDNHPWERFYSAAAGATHAYCGSRHNGLHTIDIQNPSNPVLVDIILEAGIQFEGVLLNGSTLYAARHDAGVEIFDVSTPNNPASLSVLGGFTNAFKFVQTGSTVYVADGTGGIKVLDVSTPTSPSIVGSAATTGAAQDVTYRNDLLAVAVGAAGVDIFDVTDRDSPVWMGNYDSSSSAFNIDFSTNGHVFIADWDDIEVADVSDPTNPFRTGWEDTPGRVMGLVSDGDLVYVVDWDTFRTYEYGNVTQPDIHVTPPSIVFDEISVGESDSAVVTVTNTGVGTLIVDNVNIFGSSAFSASETSFQLMEDEMIDLTVTFTPFDENQQNGTLRLPANDPDESEGQTTLRGNPSTVQVGDVAPNFTLTGIDGLPYTLSDYQGRIVVLAWFASW